MESAKTIAIIGATEKLGADLAKSLGKHSTNRLLLMSTDEAGLRALKSEIEKGNGAGEILTMSCERDASWEADIIVVAPFSSSEQEITDKIQEVAVGKIVILLSRLTGVNRSAAVMQRLLRDSHIVGVCPAGMEPDFVSTTEALIAGNNGDAVETVVDMLKSAGLRPVVTGDLGVSHARADNWRIDLNQVLSYLRSMTRALR